MNNQQLLQAVGMFIFPLLAVLVPLIIGRRYGVYRSRRSADTQQEPVGSVVGASFGLLAFMLAFTFQIATDRYDARRKLLLQEVTNIRTTWLRAGLIPEPFRSDSRQLLAGYVDLRVSLDKGSIKNDFALSRSRQILDTFWHYTEALAAQDRSSEVYALYTTSINDLVDNYNLRVTMTRDYRIPAVVLWVLFIIEFFSVFALGYQFGISGRGSFRINLLLAIIFAVTMFLILALDRPETGLVKLNQKPMHALQRELQERQ